MKDKRKRLFIIIMGVLVIFVILIWPAAPLWSRLGFEPFCISGNFPELKIVACKPPESGPANNFRSIPTPTGQGPIPIIFDDDGSPDGMIALMYFLNNPSFEVKAITISEGEAHPDQFVPHVQQMLAHLGRTNIPVGIGSLKPLEGINAFPDPWRQASDKFWGINFPEKSFLFESISAADLIVQILNNSTKPVMVFISGTHTNLAEALRLDAGIAKHIREIFIMGGAIHVPGNINSDWPEIQNTVAEWNIWVDPVAAKEVFAAGVPIHLTPLDATNQIVWTKADLQFWMTSRSAEGKLAGNILQWMLESWSMSGVYIWDLVTAVTATDPELCPEIPFALDVLIDPGPEQGRLVEIDQPDNVLVCLEPDYEGVKSLAAGVLIQ